MASPNHRVPVLEIEAAALQRVAANIARVRERIAAAARRSGRDPAEVTVVAITKSFGLSEIRAAAAAGLTDMGENRVQEAEQKIPDAPAGLTWHMVGSLQRNKARRAAALFQTIHSLDSVRLAAALSGYAPEGYPVLVQVNLTASAGQGGVAPGDMPDLVRFIAAETALKLNGLMTIGPFASDESAIRACFRGLRELGDVARRLAPDQPLLHLSMGMTDDFELAVEEGATLVRIGRAVFGERS